MHVPGMARMVSIYNTGVILLCILQNVCIIYILHLLIIFMPGEISLKYTFTVQGMYLEWPLKSLIPGVLLIQCMFVCIYYTGA